MTESPCSVALVDDHQMFCEILAQRLGLEADLRVVGTAHDGPSGLALCRAERPDVVLLDLDLPGIGGLQVLQALAGELPDVRVVMLTGTDDRERVLESLRCGALGYLSKKQPVSEVVDAVRRAHRGDPVLGAGALRAVLDQLATLPPAAASPAPVSPAPVSSAPGQVHLSPREREVLAHLSEGRSNAEIADLLVVSENTVKAHVSNLLRKLTARDRLQLALLARRYLA